MSSFTFGRLNKLTFHTADPQLNRNSVSDIPEINKIKMLSLKQTSVLPILDMYIIW